MRIVNMLAALFVITSIFSCATLDQNTSTLGSKEVTTEMLLDASPLAAGVELEDLSQVDVLEMTPEMMAFIDSYNAGAQNRYARMKRLVFAVMGEGHFELIYDDKTRTAPETFRDQQGNCLSFTNMFIAMARYLDIHASYQEVEIPPDWSIAGESFLFSQHVNVQLDLGAGFIKVVDFNIYDFNASYERRIISDQRARAHYFSNIGVDHMLEANTPLALAYFRQAIKEDRTFGPAWINMGILHRREGYPNYAETAYREAMEVDHINLIAMSNLAYLYAEEGQIELAEFYQNRVKSHRMSNPYFRYHLAQNAVIDGDYGAAIGHLKYAIRKRKDEDRFYSLLSVSYLMSGDKDAAQRWMKKAEEVAGQDADKQRYHNKLDMLMSQGAGQDGIQ